MSESTFPRRLLRSTVGGALLALLLTTAACSTPEEKAQQYYQKGEALLAKHEDVKAQIEFKNALQLRPDMTAAWYGLALLAERKGDWNALYGLLQKVVDRDPKHFDAQLKLGRLQLASGRFDAALATSNTALKLKPGDAAALALRGTVLYKLGDKREAVSQAKAALQQDPNNLDALVLLAVERLADHDASGALAYLNRSQATDARHIALQLIRVQAFEALAQLDQAEAVYRKLLEVYPDSRPLHHALAAFLLKHGEKDRAVAEYRAIAQAHPDDIQARIDVARFLQQAANADAARQEFEKLIAETPDNYTLRFALADFYQAHNDAKGQEATLQAIVQRAGDSPDGLRAKARLAAIQLSAGHKDAAGQLVTEVLAKDKRNEQALLVKASIELADRQLDDAIGDLRTLLLDAPDQPSANLLLARAHEAAGSNELAENYYQKAFQAGQMAPQFGMPYAEFLLQRNQTERAGSIAEDILRIRPDYVPAIKLLAQTKIDRQDWNAAQALADKLRASQSGTQAADQILGTLYAARQSYDQSIALFKRAYAAAPASTQPMVGLVRVYLLAGKQAEAQSFLQSVLEASPRNVEAELLLGQLNARSGNADQAIAHFRHILTVDPANTTAYTGLASLYLGKRDFAAAEQSITKGLAAAADPFPLRVTQAGLFELTGRYDEAIALYEELLKQQPTADVLANNLASLLSDHRTDDASLKRANELASRFRRSKVPQFLDTLGWTEYRLKHAQQAVSLLSSAATQMPDQPIFQYHLGMAYLASKQTDDAKQALDRAVREFDRAGAGNLPERKAAATALAGL